jgi:hypothetical protein
MEYLLGFLIALAVGLTGMGGGVLTTPLLILGLGLPAHEAVAVALLFSTLTKVIATPFYASRGQLSWPVAKLLLIGGLPGVIAGSFLLNKTSSKTLEPYVLTIVGGTIVVMTALTFLKPLFRNATPKDRTHLLPWLALPIGLEVGFSSAGAGALGSLLLLSCTTLTPSAVVGTDLFFGLVISAAGGSWHALTQPINTALLLKLSSGGVAGALIGAWLGTRIPTRALRTALSAFLFFLGGQLCWKGIAVLAR